ncbi:hypoxanthine phosphoribosyltransferase [Archaeoglobus veneficus SNP6]|uniref:hypoxanthine phosphoribosyltransferase n=2 Tax=Archaeoglobus veneficus TaxID=58290 RepID=F2KT77_ARCVS|nr:hypoxanthine phosphoribosyltransferase [Archaeoglobus veneficus SNP6]
MELELLIGGEEIRGRVKELAEQISKDYRDRIGDETPLLIGILNGAFIFLADLIRELSIPVEVDFVKLKSYVGTNSTGTVEVKLDVEREIEGRDVIVVEDIIDTGITMEFFLNRLKKKKPKSIAVCTLLDKPERRIVDVKPDYVGFTIPDYFVVGYGLDFNGRYRELPAIYRVKP